MIEKKKSMKGVQDQHRGNDSDDIAGQFFLKDTMQNNDQIQVTVGECMVVRNI